MRGLSSGVSLLGGGIGDILEMEGTEEANNAKLEPKMNIKKLLDIFGKIFCLIYYKEILKMIWCAWAH